MRPILLLITGQKHSGKTTLANYLSEHNKFNHVALADPMKDLIRHTLNIELETLEWLKNNPATIAFVTPNGQIIHNTNTTMRNVLQNFGEHAKVVFNDREIWCKLTAMKLSKQRDGSDVISDLRLLLEHNYFKNEYVIPMVSYNLKFVDELRPIIIVIRLITDTHNNDSHQTEQEWMKIPADLEIHNDFTGIEKLGEQVLKFIDSLNSTRSNTCELGLD